jgi:rare lipoprotein A
VVRPERLKPLYLIALLSILSACSSRPVYDSAPAASVPSNLPGDATPRDEPRSRYGNGPYYKVYGKTYEVLDTNYGYQERGVASWYGTKFHGQLTSSHERYDMYAMTAAHKSLPLPSYVRVRSLRNGKSIVVRVNDRGPFVDNRLIDLSYAAALKLDMITAGTSLVEVTAISFDEPLVQPAPSLIVEEPAAEPAAEPADNQDPVEYIFVQVGAFGDPENARRRFSLLRDVGLDRTFVYEDRNTSPALYRVRIGPIADVLQYDSIVEQLQAIGISETHLVTE